MNVEIKALAETVQHNCHIADARHAGDYTLCVYLLKMREMYRWEQQESFNTSLTTDDVGEWLTEREGQWDEVEASNYQPLTINGQEYDPFDNKAINILLQDKGLVYNAGLGLRCRPHFFLAKLITVRKEDSFDIIISGQEYARDMAAPPAMFQQGRIYIRRESLRRMLWEKVEEWRMSGLDSPVGRAANYYDFENDVELSLDKMADTEIEIIIAHEKGEALAEKVLGEGWQEMLMAMPQTHAEIMLRAIRDHYADALTTLPLLIKNNNPASTHFYFGNMTAMRKKLAPTLVAAYQKWNETQHMDIFKELLAVQESHWKAVSLDALSLYQSYREDADKASTEVAMLIESRIL